jgi:hypothetical protein
MQISKANNVLIPINKKRNTEGTCLNNHNSFFG